MPFLASLMNVSLCAVMEALRNAEAQESPEQVEQRIQQAVAYAVVKADSDLKAHELDMKERKTKAEIRKLMADDAGGLRGDAGWRAGGADADDRAHRRRHHAGRRLQAPHAEAATIRTS